MRNKRNEEFTQAMKNRIMMFFKNENITQEELGERIGIEKYTVSRILSKNSVILPTIEMVIPWCRALNISPNTLFGWYESNTKKKLSDIEEDLFSVDISIGDALFEIEGAKHMDYMRDILETAMCYLEKAKGDLDENNTGSC